MSGIDQLRAEPAVTLGIVIEVPAPWGQDIQEWRLGFGDNLADHMPTHITVVAPVSIPSGRLDATLADLDSACAHASPFDIELGGTHTFRPVSPVVYLAVLQGQQELRGLHDQLRPMVTDQLPLHDYVPHVTVAMHMPDALLDAAASALGDYSAQWTASAAASYLRGADGRWLFLHHHPFGAA